MGKGGDKFDVSTNLIINPPAKDKIAADKDKVFATLSFPKPRKITSLRVAPLGRGQLQPEVAQQELISASDSLHISTLQIFTYDIEDEAALRLQSTDGPGGHYWEPVFSGDFVNLHIFSEEDHHDRPSFSVDDLLRALAILGSNLNKVTGVLTTKGIQPGDPPDGVSPEETEDLAPRTKRMARLGRLVLRNGDPNQAWYPNDALDDDPPGCGSPVGRG